MDVVVWLRSLGLGKYEAAFRENEIDETVLPSLTEEHLKQLGRPRIDPTLEKRIQNQLRGGKGMLKIAAELGVGSGTVQRIKREMESDRPLESAKAA